MTRKSPIRTQARIRGVHRVPSHAALLPQVRRWVEREAARFGVTKSFVVAVCIAQQAGIEHEDYGAQ